MIFWRREERNRQAGIAHHTDRIAECEANLEEALLWEEEHASVLPGSMQRLKSGVWRRELEHSRSMLAMYQDPVWYAQSRRTGRLFA